ncbi:MAG: nitroreductase [Gammaproteobacteria bacterium]
MTTQKPQTMQGVSPGTRIDAVSSTTPMHYALAPNTNSDGPVAMNALQALHTRSSVPHLGDPLPEPAVLENIYKAALRAADHGVLKPWRFLRIHGAARQRLGDLFITATRADNPELTTEEQDRLRQKPMRAPLIVVVISSYCEHPKVPQLEQDLSAGAAAQNMLLAAHAQGVGAMWRTGSMAYHPLVKTGLGLGPHEKIIGFLYIGTIIGGTKNLNDPDTGDFFRDW